jgi:hypothetical protein
VESRHETPSQQEVDDTVEQSFPASDPPPWPAAVASSVTKR